MSTLPRWPRWQLTWLLLCLHVTLALLRLDVMSQSSMVTTSHETDRKPASWIKTGFRVRSGMDSFSGKEHRALLAPGVHLIAIHASHHVQYLPHFPLGHYSETRIYNVYCNELYFYELLFYIEVFCVLQPANWPVLFNSPLGITNCYLYTGWSTKCIIGR
jgi:hypothetical protein